MSNLPAQLPKAPRRPRKAHVHFSPKLQEKYLDVLARSGLVSHAAASVGVSPEQVRSFRHANPEFAAAVQRALDFYRDTLVREVHRRAHDGVEDTIYFQGQPVGKRRIYSDRLLEFLVKRHVPEFREHYTADVNVSGGVLVVGGTSESAQAWQEKFGHTLGHAEPGHEIISTQSVDGESVPSSSDNPPGQ